jgi:hypothetical protein
MRYALIVGIAIGLVTVSRISGTAAEGEANQKTVSFRVVKTTTAPVLEVKIGKVIFLTPYLKIPPNDSWPGEGEFRPDGENVSWRNGTRFVTRAALITVNLQTHSVFESGDAKSEIPHPNGFRGAAAKNSDPITLRCRKTANARMVEIKVGGAVAVTPSLRFVGGRKEVEIRPVGDKLESSDGATTATFTAMSLDP